MCGVLLQEARDVLLGAGGPCEGRAVVHELPGHDERVPPLQLAVVALAVVMDPKAAFTDHRLLELRGARFLQGPLFDRIALSHSPSIPHRLRARAHRPVAHLVSDGEGDGEPRVLVDVAAAVRLTHPGQMGQAQGLAGLVHPSADVLPGEQRGVTRVTSNLRKG